MDKVLCHFYANTYYDEWRVIITDYTDGKKPIWDNASSEGIRAYDASTSQSCFIYNSAIFAGSPEPSYHVVNVCLLANEAFTLKIQFKRSQDSEWMEANTQNYNKLNNGFYTVSSSPITIKSAVTDLRTTTIISSGFDNSKPVTSELDIPIFSDYSEYGQFVLSPAPSASVEVSYDIPQGDYDYVKLVFKKDRIPADVNDGYAVDLDPTAHSVEVSGLSKTLGTRYYFVIFTDKSVSDEFIYDVAEIPPFDHQDFAKTDNIETFTVPKTGRYKLETWGAQGGNAESDGVTARGGYGSYSTCDIELGEGQSIYVNVGGQDGYNCGGSVSPSDDPSIANGGGATTIATVSAMINGLSGNSSNRYKIMAMSGGGGGGMVKDNTAYDGNNSGGWKGSGSNSSNINSGNAWGYGATGYSVSGGGAGYRGGYAATSSEGGGGGCASMANFYFGNRWNKKMVGYNVPTTTGDNYTESTDKASANAESDKAKMGDGFARITYISDLPKKSKVMPQGSMQVEMVYQSLNYEWVYKSLDEILVMVKNITMASGNGANAFFYIPYGYNTGGGFIMPAYVSSRSDLYILTEETLMYNGGDYDFSSGYREIGVNNIDCIDQQSVNGGYILNSQKTALYRNGNHSPVVIEKGDKIYQVAAGNNPLQIEDNPMTFIFYTDASITNIYVDGVKQ